MIAKSLQEQQSLIMRFVMLDLYLVCKADFFIFLKRRRWLMGTWSIIPKEIQLALNPTYQGR